MATAAGVLALLMSSVLWLGNGHLFTLSYANGAHHGWAWPLTHLGDSLVLCGLLAWVLPRGQLHTLLWAIALVILTGLAAQALKHGLFAHWLRPAAFYSGQPLPFAADSPRVQSFPSGHATTIFTAMVLLWAVIRPVYGQILLVIGALLLAYTRVWVGAHFPLDVVGGGVLGLVLSLVLAVPLWRVFRPVARWAAAARVHLWLRWLGALLATLQWAQLTWAIF
jgi:membrane-associated phospholipid phosphatase